MKILFLSIVPSPYQRDLFAALSKQEGLDIQVNYAEAGSPDSPWPKESLAPYESVSKSFYLSWRGKRFIVNRQLPDLEGVDLVVLNGYVTIPAQWILRFRSKKLPMLFWAEKMEPNRGGIRGFLQSILIKPLHRVSGIVAIGKKASRDYAIRFPDKPIYELPYYCSLKDFQQSVPDRPRMPVTILFCGQMIARKGVDLLLAAVNQLVSEGLDLRLLLVGREAELPEMMKSVSDEAREKIEFAGFQSPGDLPTFYAQSDIFVLPSRYDGWGVVVNQALGAGLPAVCSDAVGSAEDLVEPGVNGFIFPNGDVGTLTDQLRELVSSPEKIRAFAQASLEKSHHITPESGAVEWARILEETLEKYHARPAR